MEQNPSDDDINRVRPSIDLYALAVSDRSLQIMRRMKMTYHDRSVKVAKWRLLTAHSGVCCCVSYTNTVSCVATAYTIRYGKAKAGSGPGLDEPLSPSIEGDGLALLISLVGGGTTVSRGGGSIVELVGGTREASAGSGNDGIEPSAEEVSKVICLVVDWVFR